MLGSSLGCLAFWVISLMRLAAFAELRHFCEGSGLGLKGRLKKRLRSWLKISSCFRRAAAEFLGNKTL